ncbi:MAG: phosphoethanolamine--lipid A transferase [Sulfurovum sp.]|nr:phosphoethanolamine--lipid A transferase [Sulfurovum sp.]
MRKYTPIFFITSAALFIVLFLNISFFEHVLKIYPLEISNISFLLSLALVLYALLVILFSLLSFKYTTKPILIFALILSASIQYFMQSYNIVMDKTMIENTIQTDMKESFDLLSLKLFLSLFFLAIIPSFILYKIPLHYRGFKAELWSKFKLIMIHLALIGVLLFSFSKFYTSFFREYKTLRLYTNPIASIYNTVAYTYEQYKDRNIPMKIIGEDAKINSPTEKKRKIVIMVVGEAARADHFSLNGYEKETNPLLKKEDIINFSNMYSCGTTTAVSVPCMFSVYDRDEYNTQKGYNTHNALDILSRVGVQVLWRDNNSNSKGVAVRLKYEHYKTPALNTICEKGECRDEGMLVGLDDLLNNTKKDTLIVLHQMGNHGPAYYLRYPEKFKQFSPVCKTNQLEECSKEEISNAYDNAILYTDYFLSKVIALLKQHSQASDTAMVYMADHGESLGENGFYLHGLPYFMAPDHQKHVGALMWFSKTFPLDKNSLIKRSNNKYTHDNLFSTLLGIFNVDTDVYETEMDILRN